MNSGEAMRAERLKKLTLLNDAGVDAYPAESRRSISIAEFLKTFEHAGEQTLVGRILSIRKQGGIAFIDVYDGTERVQFVLQKTELGDAQFDLFNATIDQGDFIEAAGTPFTTKKGQRSLLTHSWRILSKSISPIPDEWYGLKDEELRLRLRPIDILLNPDLRQMFERRAQFWFAIRAFLMERGFTEVETPTLEVSPGGADARPFVTRHNALDMDVYLRIAPELWLKRLLIAGFPKVFEIGRIFRNEGQSREHLQDYTQLETYEAYSDMHKGMKFVQELYRHVAQHTYGTLSFSIHGHEVDLGREWPEVNFCMTLKEKFNVDPITCSEEDAVAAAQRADITFGDTPNKARAVDHLWKQVRKGISGPAFLVGVPEYLEPLAKRSPTEPQTVERFQVLLAGSEVGKGFSELNDPQDQHKRLEAQQDMRDSGDDEAQRLDLDYIGDMEYGMPPAFGFGVSERLFAFLEDKPAHEAQLFPLLRPKK